MKYFSSVFLGRVAWYDVVRAFAACMCCQHVFAMRVIPKVVCLHSLPVGQNFYTSAVVVSSGDLGIGRTFTASSTCGLVGPQTYCVLNPENGDRQCFTCDASEPAQSHPTTFLTDADSGAMSDRTWWQAENGLHNVTLELKLEALFSFSHLVITFCSPRPAAAVVERSRDFGATYQPYQFYSNNCEEDFGMPARSGVRTVDEVICTSEYSSIEPLTNGEVSILNGYCIHVINSPFTGNI